MKISSIYRIIGIFFLKNILTVYANSPSAELTNSTSSEHSEGISVAGLHITKLETHITILIFILIVVILKMIYHHLHHILAYIPESCILIILGVIFGAVLKYGLPNSTKNWSFTSDLFFLYLLPPIILDAAFCITNKSFAANLGIILIFAVLGTIFNFLIIGFVLYGLQYGGAMNFESLTLKGSLLYSSLIVAVDPVAVLAIFEDLGVNHGLYYMVFGESLLNDAVTIVLYQIMEAFSKTDDITAEKIGLGVAKFLTVSFGALSIGIVIGVVCCQITRFTKSCRVYEPIIIIATAYLAYILGDLFEWSGIISMIGCGCVQAGYAFHNISDKSVAVIRRVIRMVAHVSEAVIFLYLGIEVIISEFIWHTGFILWSLVVCLVARTLVVVVLCFFINISKVHKKKINLIEQFVISYGGLRGAVAYSLAALINESYVGGSEVRSIFISSTLFTIFFTVGAMGITMKPLAKLFKVKLVENKGLSMVSEMNENVMGHLTAGIEEIIGMKGENYVRDLLMRWDYKYIRKALMTDPETHDEKIIHTYEKICLALHQATVTRVNSEHYLNKLSGAYKKMKIGHPSSENMCKDKDLPDDNECSHDTLHDLVPVHHNDEHVALKRRRMSTGTDADIKQMFIRSRSNSIAEAGVCSPRHCSNNFLDRLHEVLDRRKRNITHHSHHSSKRHHLNINGREHNGLASHHSGNHLAVPELDNENHVSLKKVSVVHLDEDEQGTTKGHDDPLNSDSNAETRVRVCFEIPDDVEQQEPVTKL